VIDRDGLLLSVVDVGGDGSDVGGAVRCSCCCDGVAGAVGATVSLVLLSVTGIHGLSLLIACTVAVDR
jgi:hypothetical protein